MVEAVVSIMIASLLLGVLVVSVIGSLQTTNKAELRQKQSAVAEAVWQRVQADGKWARSGRCASAHPVTCSPPDALWKDAARDPAGDLEFQVSVVAQSVDTAADGLGVRDRDGQRADALDVKVRVEYKRKGKDIVRPFVIGGIFDPEKAGQAGVISLQVCEVFPQIDEQARIVGCVVGGTTIDVQGPVLGSNSTFAADEDDAWNAAASFQSITGQPYTRLTVRPVSNATVKLKTASGKPVKTARTGRDGRLRFDDLEPRVYAIDVKHPNATAFTPWLSHTSPARDEAAVSSGEELKAVHLFQPNGVDVVVNLASDTGDESRDRVAAGGGYWLRLLPVPFARTVFSHASALSDDQRVKTGWVKVEKGADRVTMRNVPPGVYTTIVLKQSPPSQAIVELLETDLESDPPTPYEDDPVYSGFIWVDPRGAAYHLPKQSSPQPDYPMFEECADCPAVSFGSAGGGG